MFADNRILETGFSFAEAVPEPPERRCDERFITILRVGVLIVDGRRELCLMRNISAGGLMAHVYSLVEEGQRVTVELKSNQAIGGTIAWVRGANAGIAFDESVDIAALLANPAVLDNGWRPRLPRIEVMRWGTLRAGARTWRVQSRDISQGGIKIDTDQSFEPGEEIVLTLDHFRPVPGTVRWQGRCGRSRARRCSCNGNSRRHWRSCPSR